MDERINDVTIVGGGDAGLLTGLCIRKLNPELSITIVDDFDEEIPDVGKSTYNTILRILHDFLEIDEERFISAVKPIWKGSVYFRDWCGYPAFHFPFDGLEKFAGDGTPNDIEYNYYHYTQLYDSPDHRTKGEEIVEQRKSPMYYSPNKDKYKKYENVAYHLNTNRLNSFLRSLCDNRYISLVNDSIETVNMFKNAIKSIESKNSRYSSDLFIDASGFDRVLKKQLNSCFRSFDLPLDSALNTRIDRNLAEIVPATIIETGEYGWFWQIDTFDYRDLGYVYSSSHASEADALSEFIEHCNTSLTSDDVARFEFDSGYYEEMWEQNCIAIGNAGGFVEPLQSTGLTANAEAAVTLSELLALHGRVNHTGIREIYNEWVDRTWRSIYDFITIHYEYSDGSNTFWNEMQSMALSSRADALIEEYSKNGFSDREFTDLRIFHPKNFYEIMRNMQAESAFYESHAFEVSNEIKTERDRFYTEIENEVSDHLTVEEVYKGIVN